MSRLHTYVGPFVECRTTQEQKTGVQRGCTNSSCTAPKPAHKEANFCPRCGHAIGEVPVTWTTNNVHPHQMMEDVGEVLMWMPGSYSESLSRRYGIHLYIGNRLSDAPAGRQFRFGDEWVEEVDSAAPLTDKAHFMSYYADALKSLVAAYGEGKVEVKWGVILYAN